MSSSEIQLRVRFLLSLRSSVRTTSLLVSLERTRWQGCRSMIVTFLNNDDPDVREAGTDSLARLSEHAGVVAVFTDSHTALSIATSGELSSLSAVSDELPPPESTAHVDAPSAPPGTNEKGSCVSYKAYKLASRLKSVDTRLLSSVLDIKSIAAPLPIFDNSFESAEGRRLSDNGPDIEDLHPYRRDQLQSS
ncbi:hypothetical protein GALMADRAFT_1207535 [Galerina marginata CBS 339.88]|uniref:Uncharacterized protein n=1 Tax=Galerina marginata (strain CBS 339.88) TaxID=685588 RepID=A0A067S8G3_GALM3|nr:hypothetical protein GALMADRAFT_1207535 [Galerina marginata CBS 339.88]